MIKKTHKTDANANRDARPSMHATRALLDDVLSLKKNIYIYDDRTQWNATSTPATTPLPPSTHPKKSTLEASASHLPLLGRLEGGEVHHVERRARARHPPHEHNKQGRALPPQVEHEVARRRLKRGLQRFLTHEKKRRRKRNKKNRGCCHIR